MQRNKTHLIFLILLNCCFLLTMSFSFAQISENKFRIDTNLVNPNPSYFFFGIYLGGEYYRYQENTKNWLGDINAAHISLHLKFNKIGFGAAFKPSTNNPYQTLVFDGEPMTHYSKLNVINTEYFLTYSLDFPLGLSLEPTLGMNRVNFIVINEEELGQTFNLNSATGLLLGSKLQKYWQLQTNTGTTFQEDFFFSIFASFNHSWINFSRVHPRLNNNFYNWGFGISIFYMINSRR